MPLRKIVSITSFATSALMLIFTVWAFIHAANIISEAIAFGQITTGENLYEIFSFYMAGPGQYLIFALLLFGMGLLLCPKAACKCATEKAAPQTSNSAEIEE